MMRDTSPRYVIRPVAFRRGASLPVRYWAIATPCSASGRLPSVRLPVDEPTRRQAIEAASFCCPSRYLPARSHFTYQL